MKDKKNKYILISPVKNEAGYIEKTIESILNQCLMPACWVIVNDGSTDDTKKIIEKYSNKTPFMHLINLPVRDERHFAAKVWAIQKGFDYIQSRKIVYNYYGNLDADVTFDKNYYDFLINKMQEDPGLGITGGQLYDFNGEGFTKLDYGLHSVAGPVQFFRKACYEAIGGYTPSKVGLVDAMAEVKARMKGWKTLTFPELVVRHLRKTGSEGRTLIQSAKREGMMDYYFGIHPLFHLGRSVQRFFKPPVCIGSFLRTGNYLFHSITAKERPVSKEFIHFLHQEEFTTIKSKLKFK